MQRGSGFPLIPFLLADWRDYMLRYQHFPVSVCLMILKNSHSWHLRVKINILLYKCLKCSNKTLFPVCVMPFCSLIKITANTAYSNRIKLSLKGLFFIDSRSTNANALIKMGQRTFCFHWYNQVKMGLKTLQHLEGVSRDCWDGFFSVSLINHTHITGTSHLISLEAAPIRGRCVFSVCAYTSSVR